MLKTLSLSQKMFGGVAALAATAVVASGIGLWAVYGLSAALLRQSDYTSLAARQMHADMMHDALRGDVLSSLAADDPAMGIKLEDVKADLREHTDSFLADIDHMAQFRGDAEVERSVAAVTEPLTTTSTRRGG